MTIGMTKERRRRMALEQMKLVRYHYARLQTEYEAATGSHGMVSVWGRVGGGDGRIAKPTQERALSAISAEDHRKAMLRWFECIRETCLRLKARGGKSAALWRHHLILARALQLYVFQQADAEVMALMLGAPKKLNRTRVTGILREAADEVAKDAEQAGLFREGEAAS